MLQIFFLFVFGLCVGSFLNVLIYRLPNELSPLKGRSFCDHCKHQLAWKDNIPLLSFPFLRSRCRYCHSPISWQHPVVEMITGLAFVFVYQWVMGWCSASFDGYMAIWLYGYIVSSLIVVFFADLKYQIIPDKIVYPAMIIAGMSGILGISGVSIKLGMLSGLGAGGFFLALFLLTRGKGMGFGDVKFAFLMGLILGFPKIIIALYLAFLTGALVGVILILSKKKRFGQHIPFGPFLVGGTVVSMFYGNQIW